VYLDVCASNQLGLKKIRGSSNGRMIFFISRL
jgi:hypothetical protein